MLDEWISEPKKDKFEIDRTTLQKKIKSWTDQIDLLISQTEDEDIDDDEELIKQLKNTTLNDIIEEFKKIKD